MTRLRVLAGLVLVVIPLYSHASTMAPAAAASVNVVPSAVGAMVMVATPPPPICPQMANAYSQCNVDYLNCESRVVSVGGSSQSCVLSQMDCVNILYYACVGLAHLAPTQSSVPVPTATSDVAASTNATVPTAAPAGGSGGCSLVR